MSHRKPTKTNFHDEWRDYASCVPAVAVQPELKTAWDNIDIGSWEHGDEYGPDPQEFIAQEICRECPVRLLCLKDAIKDNLSEGIRGGFRFDQGTVSKEDARVIFNEFALRARVRKRGNSVRSEEVPEVWTDD